MHTAVNSWLLSLCAYMYAYPHNVREHCTSTCFDSGIMHFDCVVRILNFCAYTAPYIVYPLVCQNHEGCVYMLTCMWVYCVVFRVSILGHLYKSSVPVDAECYVDPLKCCLPREWVLASMGCLCYPDLNLHVHCSSLLFHNNLTRSSLCCSCSK